MELNPLKKSAKLKGSKRLSNGGALVMADEAEDTAAGTQSIDTQPVPTVGIDRADAGPGQSLVAAGEVDLDAILQGLEAEDGELPEAAILAARGHSAAITPKLIEAIETATATLRRGEPFDGNLPFYAFYLLGEFRATEALPAIVEALSLPEVELEILLGDALTMAGSRVLAYLASDRQDVIDALIDNRLLYEYVRWEAAGSLKYLVRDGLITREAAVERLRFHLRTAIDNFDEPVIGFLVCELDILFPAEAKVEIDEAFDKGFVEQGLIDRDCLARTYAKGEEGVREYWKQHEYSAHLDILEEFRGWKGHDDGGEEEGFQENLVGIDDKFVDIDDFGLPEMETTLPPPIDQPIRAERHPGRNDPCSCGSGKKYKKCCGAPGKAK
ncbi:MAG: DUF1186 domain-containing protein [Planctomycetia bacterium]|nr:DUF1186 domain-containing protein [Planctomycetia bacterium]